MSVITIENTRVCIDLNYLKKNKERTKNEWNECYDFNPVLAEALRIKYDYLMVSFWEKDGYYEAQISFRLENCKGCRIESYDVGYEDCISYDGSDLNFCLKDMFHIKIEEEEYPYSYSSSELFKSFPNHNQRDIENLVVILDTLLCEGWQYKYHGKEVEEILNKKAKELQYYVGQAQQALEWIEKIQNSKKK